MPQGRPKIYSPDTAIEILRRISDGESLRSICSDENMPSRPTVYSWVFDDVEGFSGRYARAREMQAHALADDLHDIADDGSNDWMERNDAKNPGWVENGEHIQRSRLRVDARKWTAARILPKVYGDKIEHEVNGQLNVRRVISEAPLTQEAWLEGYAEKVDMEAVNDAD